MEKTMIVTKQQNWSDLPHDMVLLISSTLSSSYMDILSLKRVCSSWRVAMKNRPRIAYPMLVLFAESEENLGKSINEFSIYYNINEKVRYKLKNPQLYSRSRIIGSHPDGWVIFSADESREAYILHLFLKIHIQLPNKVGTNGSSKIDKAILSANDPHCRIDFMVVMSFQYPAETMLAFWRYGECNWKSFGGGFSVYDIAFYSNRIYAIRGISSFDPYRYLEVWDVESNPSLPQLKFRVRMSFDYRFQQRLVVSSANQVFIVNFNYCSINSIENFNLSTLDCMTDFSLNGQTLLWCFGDSVILSSIDAKHIGCKSNSIYFVDKQSSVRWKYTCIDLGLCILEARKCKQLIWHLVRDANQLSRPAAFWIVISI